MKKKNLGTTLLGIVAIALVVAVVSWLAGCEPLTRPEFAKGTIVITKADGSKITYQAEFALNPDQQEYGLMFRSHLAADAAMLFLYDAPQIITMWMKNTFIPLDMIFFDEHHRIVNIITNTEPHSLDILSSQKAAIGVIEVNAGDTTRHGLNRGDTVSYSQN